MTLFPDRTDNAKNMGQFQFHITKDLRETVPDHVWNSAHFCGPHGTPWQSQTEYNDESLTIRTKIPASGKIQILWPIDGLGTRLLSTCSLSSSDTKQFHLPIELARGSCHRARTLSSAWELSGAPKNQKSRQDLDEGTGYFLEALKNLPNQEIATQYANQAIARLEQSLDHIAQDYASASISQRKLRDPKLSTLLAASILTGHRHNAFLNHPEMQLIYTETFNTAAMRINWRDIEPEQGVFDLSPARNMIDQFQSMGLRTIVGPLIDFEKELLPTWMTTVAGDFESLQQVALNYVEQTISKLKGSVQLWNCISGMNTGGPIQMDDEQIMRLSLAVLQTVRKTDPETPAVISFDQPFGEYLRHPSGGVPGLKVAETLARCGLGMAGIGLDIKMNYGDSGSMQRSAMDFSQNLDRWGNLGLPLLVQIAAPADSLEDPLAILSHSSDSDPNEMPCNHQEKILEPLLPILLAKPYIHGIVWNGWSDEADHLLPNSGLLDANQQPRPLQKYLAKLRSDHLA